MREENEGWVRYSVETVRGETKAWQRRRALSTLLRLASFLLPALRHLEFLCPTTTITTATTLNRELSYYINALFMASEPPPASSQPFLRYNGSALYFYMLRYSAVLSTCNKYMLSSARTTSLTGCSLEWKLINYNERFIISKCVLILCLMCFTSFN